MEKKNMSKSRTLLERIEKSGNEDKIKDLNPIKREIARILMRGPAKSGETVIFDKVLTQDKVEIFLMRCKVSIKDNSMVAFNLKTYSISFPQ